MLMLLNCSRRVVQLLLCCALFALYLFLPMLQAAQPASANLQGVVSRIYFSFLLSTSVPLTRWTRYCR